LPTKTEVIGPLDVTHRISWLYTLLLLRTVEVVIASLDLMKLGKLFTDAYSIHDFYICTLDAICEPPYVTFQWLDSGYTM
jgi:hypothetical protein